MRFDRDFERSESSNSNICNSANHVLKIIGRSWSFREKAREGTWIAKQPLFASLHPPLDATHHAIYRQRCARAWHQPIAQNTWRERARRARGTPSRVGREEKKSERWGERRGIRTRRERILRVPRGEILGLACPGMASSHSSVFTVRGHPRARATFGFSTSSLARVGDADINRIINDRSRRDSTNARNSRH